MSKLSTTLLAAALAAGSMTSYAADYSDGDTHKNDYKWMQANLMYALEEQPRLDNASSDGHNYLELEFGGRAGILDYYGYVDVFNLTNKDDSDKKGASKEFIKFAPRISLDGLTGKDLSFGPVQEVYFATLFNWGGGGGTNCDSDGNCIEGSDVNNSFWGVGSDIMVPWLGKIGLNLYGLYDLNTKEWNGYQVSTNWFKPFYTFENGSFLSYQGYIDYQFGADKAYDSDGNQMNTSNGGAMFNGLYWHSKYYSLGYGLKAYKDVYTAKDGAPVAGSTLNSTGFSHYFAATYKF